MDYTAVDDLGRTALELRGKAGGILPDESPVVVDRLAMAILHGVAGCVVCGGYGFTGLSGTRCEDCDGTGVDPEVVALVVGAPAPAASPTAAEMEAAGIVDPEYIGMIVPTQRNPLGYFRGPQWPATNRVPLEARPYYAAIRAELDRIVSDYQEAAHQAARDFDREPDRWPTARRPYYVSGGTIRE